MQSTCIVALYVVMLNVHRYHHILSHQLVVHDKHDCSDWMKSDCEFLGGKVSVYVDGVDLRFPTCNEINGCVFIGINSMQGQTGLTPDENHDWDWADGEVCKTPQFVYFICD